MESSRTEKGRWAGWTKLATGALALVALLLGCLVLWLLDLAVVAEIAPVELALQKQVESVGFVHVGWVEEVPVFGGPVEVTWRHVLRYKLQGNRGYSAWRDTMDLRGPVGDFMYNLPGLLLLLLGGVLLVRAFRGRPGFKRVS